MNTKKILSAVVVLALTVGRVWASAETSSAPCFTAVPESEAALIVGGDGVGYECFLTSPMIYLPCSSEPQSQCSTAYAFDPTYTCAYTGSGQCYDEPTIIGWYAECEWTNACQQVGDWVPLLGTTCW
ncbi:MAG: hypothetical protein NTZ17_19530 [Phycisphaerae bacterium]|jgi:hypothetical protein|nr:hypothetical protein [Phycisphaerae bacterium]